MTLYYNLLYLTSVMILLLLNPVPVYNPDFPSLDITSIESLSSCFSSFLLLYTLRALLINKGHRW